MKKKSIFKMMALSLLFGSICVGFVACNSDDDDSSEVNDKSPAEAIDLGLPSGTLWASCNVGATKPEEYGLYFAWGETSPKEDYSWSTYKWCNGSSSNQTKYTGNDGKTELDLEDDAAYVNWGSSWRMPSRAQQVELREQCNWTWTTLNGVNGYMVTSKTNGNSIFLPAVGWCYKTRLGEQASWVGIYWSRSLYRKPSIAYSLYFSKSDVAWGDDDRCDGLSVRPVRMK